MNCFIMGAAGRDFHNFLTWFKDRPEYRVVAFTASQIPFIADRTFPAELAGPDYPEGIPIHDESELPDLVQRLAVDFVFFAYSDVACETVMHHAAVAQAAGASFVLAGPAQTQIQSTVPVVSITASRTGAGKSPLTQWLARQLHDAGVRAVAVRHPMPYGNLLRQRVQRFRTLAELDAAEPTIEEREEYEPYIQSGLVIYAGVDYEAILRAAEQEADLILWDGENNDWSFYSPDLSIVVCDALRPGHERRFYPGETNVRQADLIVINKAREASAEAIEQVRHDVAQLNPTASVTLGDLMLEVDWPESLAGRPVVVVEDGPTVTHGGMAFGAGWVAATRAGAVPVDPRPGAVGTLRETFEHFPHLREVVPAMGYSASQTEDLEQTIRNSDAELIVDASPADVSRLFEAPLPVVRVRYRFVPATPDDLVGRVRALLNR